jgi:outer membrane receptor for ferrienterochelin and colicins
MLQKMALTLFILACLSGLVTGATVEEGFDPYDMTLDELLNIKIVVASRSEDSVMDAPSVVSVITQKDILTRGYETLEDILNSVPSFQVRRDPVVTAAGQVSVRGSKSNSSILCIIDGQRVNSTLRDSCLSDFVRFPATMIKQVEVIRGPGSALYGSNAYTGVVNIITKTSDTVVGGIFASHNKKGAYFNGRIAKDLPLWLYMNAVSDNGVSYEPTDFGLPNDNSVANIEDPMDQTVIGFKAVLNGWQLNAFNQKNTMDGFIQNSFGSLPGSKTINYTELAMTRAQVQKQWKLTSTAKVELKLSYIETSSEALYQIAPPGTFTDDSTPSSAQALLAGPTHESRQNMLNLDFSHDWANHILQYGVAYRDPKLKAAQNINNFELADLFSDNFPITSYPSPIKTESYAMDTGRKVLGLYLQDKWALSKQWKLVAGLRYDDYSDVGSSTNPRAAIIFSFGKKATLKLFHGQAFKAPSIRKLTETNNPTTIGNRDLQPEDIKTTEFQCAYADEHTTLSISYYQSTLENLIQLFPSSTGSLLEFRNETTVKTKGFELELVKKFDQATHVNIAFSHALDYDKMQTPENTFFASANYHTQLGNLNISATYFDEIEQANEFVADAYDAVWQFDMKFAYPLTKVSELYLKATNLTDKTIYGLPESPESLPVLHRGREIEVGFNVIF